MASSSSSSSSSCIRSWRTAFLTLRDETLTSSPPSALLSLLRDLILSHSSATLVSAASNLPPHEVSSDVMLLAELASAVSECQNVEDTLFHICHLVHDVSCRVRLEINSSSWDILLNFLERMVERLFGRSDVKNFCVGSTIRVKAIAEILEILRLIAKQYGRNSSLSESTKIVKLLLCIVSCSHAELLTLYRSNDIHWPVTEIGSRNPNCNSLWDVQTIAFSMIGDALSRIESSISANLWQSAVEVLRKVMDFFTSKNLLIEDNIMSRFYTTLLHCLHLVLSDPKGSLSGHVAGFVAALQMFFMYGLSNRTLLCATAGSKEKRFNSPNLKSGLMESRKSECTTYRPPHLRRRDGTSVHPPNAQSSLDCESSKFGFTSSDSEHSDNDVPAKDEDRYRSSKARVAAILCIQDLCHADPKSLTSLWTMLLPENDVLQPRKYQATLMTCLLFDPILKIRIASASTLAAMLDGHSLYFLQVAEYKESTKCGSFTTLSSSLGQILMQMHRGILHLIQRETHSGLLTSLFKVLMLLISATPYARMPGELLSTVVASVRNRIMEDFAFKTEQSGLLGTALSCLGAALSRSPPSLHVSKMLEDDISTGIAWTQQKSSLLFTLFQFSEWGRHPTIRFEALQSLRAVSHNYPSIVPAFWEHISSTVLGLLQVGSPGDRSYDVYASTWKGDNGNTLGSTTEKCIMAAIKVLDECLRATSGFKGTDDLLECRLLDIQLISDCTRSKRISSAPSYVFDNLEASKGYVAECTSGIKQWCEVTEKHLPLALSHSSPMVRAASVTCFAGLTSSVFFSLAEDKKEFIISSAVTASLDDEVPSVRTAACRAIGVIACFSQIFCSTRVLNEFIGAAEFNTHDPLVSVRITASWALANICDSLRHRATDFHLEMSDGQLTDSQTIYLLVESALRLTKDGDKIKSNAVRALGNLSRFIRFTRNSTTSDMPWDSIGPHVTAQGIEFSPTSNAAKARRRPQILRDVSKSALCGDNSHWLERMVQAFVSCVTTGNVKVQWNVCHALGNLFLNDSLKLHDMSWAPSVYSILLLLLRDSTNFKIRIHAAVALAVPASRLDYGSSFSDVVQGLEHVLESLGSDQASMPSSFKYKDSLEKQVNLTTLHVLGFASSKDEQALKDFLVKKAPFLEEWLKFLCSFIMESAEQPPTSKVSSMENEEDRSTSYVPNKAMISRAIRSLLDVYECSNHQNIAWRFEKLANNLS